MNEILRVVLDDSLDGEVAVGLPWGKDSGHSGKNFGRVIDCNVSDVRVGGLVSFRSGRPAVAVAVRT